MSKGRRKGKWEKTHHPKGDERGKVAERGEEIRVEPEIERVRRARVDQAAAAGVSSGRLALEALYLLPGDFVSAYESLFHRTFRAPGTGTVSGLDPEKGGGGLDPKIKRADVRRSAKTYVQRAMDAGATGDDALKMAKAMERSAREMSGGGPQARSTGRRHREHWTVADERLFKVKGRIDRQLRRLAEDARRALAGEEVDERGDRVRCSECGRFKRSD